MRNMDIIRTRYLQNNLQLRLGGLAANLARITSFSDNPDNAKVVNSLLEESKFFIEWTISDVQLDLQAKLVELQIQLALWHQIWQKGYTDTLKRKEIAKLSHSWAEYLLQESGLLNIK